VDVLDHIHLLVQCTNLAVGNCEITLLGVVNLLFLDQVNNSLAECAGRSVTTTTQSDMKTGAAIGSGWRLVRGGGEQRCVMVAVDLWEGKRVAIVYLDEHTPQLVRRWLDQLSVKPDQVDPGELGRFLYFEIHQPILGQTPILQIVDSTP
jgi:hypothetical protein